MGGRGSAEARGRGGASGGSKIEFYEGAPQNVIDAVNESREWIASEFGQEALNVLPTRVTQEKGQSRYDIAEARSNRVIINNEKEVTTEVMVHEYAHRLTNSFLQTRDPRETNSNFDKARKDTYKAAGIKANKANDAKYVSKYGATNSHEFFSEVVAQNYNGKKNPVIDAGMAQIRNGIKKR